MRIGSLDSSIVIFENTSAPSLELLRQENEITISWPDQSDAFALETIDTFASPMRWTPVDPCDGGKVIVRLGPGSKYYRLTRKAA